MATGTELESENPNNGITAHAVERLTSQDRGTSAQFIPVRFIPHNKLTKYDQLLVVFDALVLSDVLGREVPIAKIIHEDDHTKLKLKVLKLQNETLRLISKMTVLLATGSPPDLFLNRHCAECEFQARRKQKAIEKDDLSLLSNIKEKEREKFNSKGIFTRQSILANLVKGNLIHADETTIALKDRRGYVWVFAGLHAVVYFYADTREGDVLHRRLDGYMGVLVSELHPWDKRAVERLVL